MIITTLRAIRVTPALLALIAALSVPIGASANIPQPGAPAPNFSLELIANGHGNASLDAYRGKAVYLNFFASWCVPCKEEVPSIAAFAKAYAKRGVVVIGVDELESVAAARGFVTRYHLPYPIGLDDSGSLGASYGLIGLPLHVFIGTDGKIVARRSGEMTPDQIRAGLDQIARR